MTTICEICRSYAWSLACDNWHQHYGLEQTDEVWKSLTDAQHAEIQQWADELTRDMPDLFENCRCRENDGSDG